MCVDGSKQESIDLTRVQGETPDIRAAIITRFTNQPWKEDQAYAGNRVTSAAIEMASVIIANVPPSPMRTRALNELETCRMIANLAITHRGKL